MGSFAKIESYQNRHLPISMKIKDSISIVTLIMIVSVITHAFGTEGDGHGDGGGGGDFVVTIVPSPKHTTAEGTVHNCLGEAVELSWTGDPTPPSGDCEGDWEEQVDQRTFKWSGAIVGPTDGETAKLDTTSEGQATVELTVTCKWICSDSGDTGKTTGKGSFETLIVKGESGEDPDTPTSGAIDLPDREIDQTERKGQWAGGRLVMFEHRYVGSMTNVSGGEEYDEGVALPPGGCGIDVNRTWSAGGEMSSVSFLFERALSSFSKVRLQWDPFAPDTLEISIPRHEFKRARIKVFKKSISNPSGEFTGTYSWTTLSGPPRGQSYPLNGVSFTATGAQTYEYVQVHRFTKCCPSN